GGHRQIAFVLAILVVDENHHAPVAECLQRRFDACRSLFAGHLCTNFSTYFPIRSTSRFTFAPACFSVSVVAVCVCGMIDTSNPRVSTRFTVRLIPSTAIDPFSTT